MGSNKNEELLLYLLFTFNFALCFVAKVLSIMADAFGPFLITCGIVFYFACKKSRLACVCYYILSVFAFLVAIYGGALIYLGQTTLPEYRAFFAVSVSYILLGITHIAGCVLLLRAQRHGDGSRPLKKSRS